MFLKALCGHMYRIAKFRNKFRLFNKCTPLTMDTTALLDQSTSNTRRSKVITDWINVDGCPTHVLRIGAVTSQTKYLILIIPGNPGISDYYEEFMLSLHELSSLPVRSVSHACHVLPEQQQAEAASFCHTSLSGQIQHKLSFIAQEVPPSVRLILVGHSIGCYMILSIMRALPTHRVFKSALLFPTIERMAESPSGRYATPLLKYLRWAIPYLVYPISWLPESVKSWVIRWHLALPHNEDISSHADSCSVRATLKLLHANVVSNVLGLAHCEMCEVREVDLDIILDNLDRLLLYYGSNDRWASKQDYYEPMRRWCERVINGSVERRISELNVEDLIRCDELNTEHAFVLNSSDVIARVVHTWISKYIHEDI